ncbi:hypothetical protein FRC09_004777 [Ceratobasidium sp. 395]|nr:hypothetical protein FRC09_004777 [Ceratobasidium sp. 395]
MKIYSLLSALALAPEHVIEIITTMLASLLPSLVPANGKLNLGVGLRVLQQIRAQEEGAGDVEINHLTTYTMLRARVVLCAKRIVEEVDSKKLEESLRKVGAKLGIMSTRPDVTQSDGAEQEKVEGTKTVIRDVSNRTQPSNNKPLPIHLDPAFRRSAIHTIPSHAPLVVYTHRASVCTNRV